MTRRAGVVAAGYDRDVHVVDEVLATAPLGLRFWDAVLDRPVGGGLTVRASPVGGGASTTAGASSAGVYGFTTLPTTRTAERRSARDFGPPDAYRVHVIDPRGRFVAAAFTVGAPAGGVQPATGTVPPVADSPTTRGFFLFSAHSRSVPAGCIAVRADLRDATAPVQGEPHQFAPAPHALVAVETEGSTWYGVSDRGGRLVVILPAPVFQTTTGPATPRHPRQQTWPATVEVRYAALVAAPDGGPPDFGDVAAQGVAEVDLAGAPASSTSTEIRFGQELVLRSPDRSDLLVTPA